MRLLTVPAAYAAYVESELARIERETGLDADCRADEDTRVQRLALIPNAFVDPTAQGTLVIFVVTAEPASVADLIAHTQIALVGTTRKTA
jgi:hypothetical protein